MQELSVEIKKSDLTLGGRLILEIPYLSIYQWDRIGIVGSNGQGKTSLLKLLAGELEPDNGQVIRKSSFGFFQQTTGAIEGADYSLLSKWKVSKGSCEGLSGGEETRQKLAHVLSDYQEGLILDEPTTHLDSEGIELLIEALSYYYGTLVVVSHDRYFLDQTITKIWEVANGHVKEYQGNYSAYHQQKEAESRSALNAQKNYQKEKRRLEEAVAEKQAKAQKMSQVSDKQKKRRIKPSRLGGSKQKDTAVKGIQKAAKGIEKRMSQLAVAAPIIVESSINFRQKEGLKLHNKFPIMGESVTLVRGDKQLLKEADFQFALGEVIALQGPNGCGKSSLLAHILAKDKGIIVSPKVVFGTFEQQAYRLTDSANLVTYLLRGTDYHESLVRAVLHQLDFSQNDLLKRVSDLSGGEKNRLLLGCLFLKESNVLILDEPTNFIDLRTSQALEGFIKGYPCTILLTSLDRYFVERVATQVWQFKDEKLVLK